MIPLPERNVFYPELNFVARERLDPLIFFLAEYLGISQSVWLFTIGQLVILFLGMVVLLNLFTRARFAQICGGLFSVVLVILFVGFDPHLLRVHWFPMLLAGLLQLGRTRRWFGVFPVTIILLMWILSSGSLAVFGILLAAGISLWLAPIYSPVATIVEERNQAPLILATIAGCLCGLLLIPEYPMPLYPSGARLLTGAALQSIPAPLLGPMLEPLSIGKAAFFSASSFYSLRLLPLLLGLIVACALILWQKFDASTRLFEQVATKQIVGVVSLTLLGGVLLTGHRIFPLASAPFFVLASLVPGLAVAALPWSLLGFFAVCLTLVIFSDVSRIVATALLGGALVSLFLPFGWAASIFGVSDAGSRPRQAFTGNSMAPDGYVKSAAAKHGLVKASVFPSQAVVETYGSWILEEGIAEQRHFANLKRLVRDTDAIWRLSARPNPQMAQKALDGNVFSRWTTEVTSSETGAVSRRGQRQGDMLQIDFSEAVEVVRAVLSIKDNPSQYPRGIRVLAGSSSEDLREVVRQVPWHGPVKWTKDGFPYFGGYHEVILDFPRQERVQVLRFEQLVVSDATAWSVNEIKLYAIQDGDPS